MNRTARQIMTRRVDAFPVPPREPTAVRQEPYCVMETEQVVNQLVTLRSESEQYIVEQALRPRRRTLPEGDSAMTDTNAIAVLSMLGTKGSVSNLVLGEGRTFTGCVDTYVCV